MSTQNSAARRGDDIELQARAHALIADLPRTGPRTRIHAQRALELLASVEAAADQRTVAHATLTLHMAQLALGGGLERTYCAEAGAAEAGPPGPRMVDRTEKLPWLLAEECGRTRWRPSRGPHVDDVANAEGTRRHCRIS